MIRKIWLTNIDNTERFEFTDFGDFIFSTPTSLGIYRNKEYLTINNQRIVINDVPQYKDITGTIIIKGANKDLEAKYARLRDFISKHNDNGFRLYVKTQENKAERYVKCAISSLDKSEKSTANTMLIPITLQPLSLWLGDVSGTSVAQADNVAGMFKFVNGCASFIQRNFADIYGETYYSIAFSSSYISQAIVFNSGEEQTPLLIKVYGETVNPYIKLKDYKTGEILQYVRFNGLTVPSGSYLEIDSNPERAIIEVVNENNERLNVQGLAEQDSTMFINLPVGNYIIEVSDEIVNNAVKTRVFFTNQYKGA